MTQTLTDISIRLNEDYRVRHKAILPLGFFVTDQDAVPEPEKIIGQLPKGFGVIFRDYDADNREELAWPLRVLSETLGIYFLVAGDVSLAEKLSADGLHLPEAMGGQAALIRKNHPDWIISVACHDEMAVKSLAKLPVDFALIAPVFPTHSHPDTFSGARQTLGCGGGTKMARISPKPLYGLGGITIDNAHQLIGSGLAGIAAIRGFKENQIS